MASGLCRGWVQLRCSGRGGGNGGLQPGPRTSLADFWERACQLLTMRVTSCHMVRQGGVERTAIGDRLSPPGVGAHVERRVQIGANSSMMHLRAISP